MQTNSFIPPTIAPPGKVLGVMGSLRAVRRNVLSILPAISFTQPIVTGTTGPARWHMVQGPEGMKRVFLDNVDNYPKAEVMIRMLRPAVGRSLFNAEGADWRWQRRAIAPVFSARNVTALAPFMTETATRAADRLATHSEPREILTDMLSATFDVICDVALSGRDHFNVEAYSSAITRYFETVGRASLLDFMNVPPWFPRPAELTGAGAVRTMHRMVTDAIEARRTSGPGPVDDLLDYMLSASDPDTGRQMSPRDLLHNMQFFIVAGHETTAIALSWALMMLAHDPQAQKAASDQARSVLNQRAATAADLAQMPLVDSILQESLRLYPPVGLLARQARASDQIYDRDIKAKDTVFLNIYAMHRHEMYWDAPNTFRADRHLPQNSKGRDKYLNLPFGAGPRICVGANFAMMQASIILATLLARYRFEPGGDLPRPVMHMTIRPDPGIMLKAHPI